MALFELTELASLLQRDLDTASATLARDLATGLVTDVTGVLEQLSQNLPVVTVGDRRFRNDNGVLTEGD